MKNRIAHCAATCIATLLLASCGDNSDFRVHGSISGLGTQNLRVAYATDEGIKSFTTTAIDGEFSFIGVSRPETVVEIFTNDRQPLASLIVKNGQTVECRLDRTARRQIELSGNDASKALAEFIRAHESVFESGDAHAINALIAEYVGKHSDSMTSTALMMTEFQTEGMEQEADSLWNLIDVRIRPGYMTGPMSGFVAKIASGAVDSVKFDRVRVYARGDSAVTIRPQAGKLTLLAFTNAPGHRGADFTGQLRKLHGMEHVRVADIGMWLDTAEWKQATRSDSATWFQGWVPGGTSARGLRNLDIPSLPYFIVVDSAGCQIWRGTTLDQAVKILGSRH